MLKKQEGFTLVELIVVIAIIGVLVTFVIIAIDPVRVIQDAQDTKRRTEMNQLKTALQMYFNDNKSYPAADASGKPTGLTTTYMKQLPKVTDVSGFQYAAGGSGTDYDAKVPVNHKTTDDDNSVSKCTGDGSNFVSGASGDYMICPD